MAATANRTRRSTLERRCLSKAAKRLFRNSPKAVRKAVASGDKSAAQTVFRTSTSTIDSIADKRIIHKNKAARHTSRLSAAIKAMAA